MLSSVFRRRNRNVPSPFPAQQQLGLGGDALQHGHVVLTGGVGGLGPLAGEFPVARQDDQPLEIQGNVIFGKRLQGRIVAHAVLVALPGVLKLAFQLDPLAAHIDQGSRITMSSYLNLRFQGLDSLVMGDGFGDMALAGQRRHGVHKDVAAKDDLFSRQMHHHVGFGMSHTQIKHANFTLSLIQAKTVAEADVLRDVAAAP
jgi:hypothetical protein